MTNTGSAALNISAISITGTNAANFKTGVINCGTSLAAGANCTIPVTFGPATTGNSTAAVSVSDDATGSPQTVSLAGMGSGISLMSPTNQTSVTVKAGQTATFNLQVVPTAFTGNVSISCSGAPAGTICAVSPASVAVSGNTPMPVTVTATTTGQAHGLPITVGPHFDRMFWISLLGLALLGAYAFAQKPGRRLRPGVVFVAFVFLALAGCSGATGTNPSQNTGTSTGTNGGTPAGTSTLTVTAVSGSTQSAIPLTLVVN
jgi:hypothetical protein